MCTSASSTWTASTHSAVPRSGSPPMSCERPPSSAESTAPNYPTSMTLARRPSATAQRQLVVCLGEEALPLLGGFPQVAVLPISSVVVSANRVLPDDRENMRDDRAHHPNGPEAGQRTRAVLVGAQTGAGAVVEDAMPICSALRRARRRGGCQNDVAVDAHRVRENRRHADVVDCRPLQERDVRRRHHAGEEWRCRVRRTGLLA